MSGFTPEQEARLRLIMREEIAAFRMAEIEHDYAQRRPRSGSSDGRVTPAHRSSWVKSQAELRSREEGFVAAALESLS